MHITLDNIGRKFENKIIFSNLSYTLLKGKAYSVLGPNGSGKTTFLKILAGFLSLSEGKLIYNINDKEIPLYDAYKYVSVAAPYIELIEEFTVKKMLDFHFRIKHAKNDYSLKYIIDNASLNEYVNTPVSKCSSGIRQRLRLAIAVFTESSLLLLDEPLTNLDNYGIEWYKNIVLQNLNDRIVVVSSNNNIDEYFFCKENIVLNRDYIIK